MKKEILKIAGVKSEKEFYKKFPDEASFMAKHGKAFKKAQIGAYIGGEQGAGFQPIGFKDVYDEADYAITGSTEDIRREEAYRQAEIAAAQQAAQGGGGRGFGNIGSTLVQAGEAFAKSGAFAKKGKNIKKGQGGLYTPPGTPISLPQPPGMNYAWANVSQQPVPMPPQSAMYPMQTQGASFAPTSGGIDVEVKKGDWMQQIGKYAPGVGKIFQAVQQLKDEKEALQRARQAEGVSDIALEAARIRPEQTERKYLRPEQITNTGEEFFPIYGVGTNVLARDGKMVGGIPGEIANTFAPNTLYDDLGYEPLNDSERYKQFYYGGRTHKAQNGDWLQGEGIYDFASAGGGDLASNLITSIGGENAGGNLGGSIGGTIGSAFGPAGKMIGQVGGQLIGAALDRKPQKIKKARKATQRNIQSMALQQGIPGAQAQYTSFMKDGGMTTSPYEWVSHTWQPQVITTFGEHKVKDLLKPPADADMLRAGGHLKAYTPPSAAAMSTERPMMQMGGELETHWGGYAEPMSYNPYLPDGGETIMFRGQSHDESDGRGNTGIGITYGDNPVEVERGEPAIKMQDGGTPGDSSLVVFGNLKIPKSYLPFLGPEAKDKKFKTFVADISKKENTQTKAVDRELQMLDQLEVSSPIDKITQNALSHSIEGRNSKLKDFANKKIKAASLQNAINDTAEEMGLVADDLAKGKVKINKEAFKEAAKFGKMIKAQGGAVTPPVSTKEKVAEIMALYNRAKEVNAQSPGKKNPFILELQKKYHEYFPEVAKKIILNAGEVTRKAKGRGIKSIAQLEKLPIETILDTNLDEYFGPRTEQYIAALPTDTTPPPETPPVETPTKEPPTTVQTTTVQTTIPIIPYKTNTFVDILSQALPYIRPTDMEELDPNQLTGEMYALATNQLEPVQAQTIQPVLSVPYDISYQDILNENEAAYRSQQRLVGYNPSLQGQLSAQKYAANQKVLAEQFRANQAMKDQVYRDNRNILNQYGLQNLAILDRQYERQAAAKSKTKATTQAALNSISDKYLRNQLENRTLATYENLYNYRYDPRFRAINMNAPFQPRIPTVYIGPDGKQYQSVPVLDDKGNVISYQQQAVGSSTTAPAVTQAPVKNTVPAAAPSAAPVPMMVLPSQMKEQPDPFKEEIEITGKKGVKVDKKKKLNSTIVKAFKNL